MGDAYDTSWRDDYRPGGVFNSGGNGSYGGYRTGRNVGISSGTERDIRKGLGVGEAIFDGFGLLSGGQARSANYGLSWQSANSRLEREIAQNQAYAGGYSQGGFSSGFNRNFNNQPAPIQYGGNQYTPSYQQPAYNQQGAGMQRSNSADPQGQFVSMLVQAQATNNPALMQQAVDFASNPANGLVDSEGKAHFHAARYPLPNQKHIDFDGTEVKTPREMAMHLAGQLARSGIGNAPVVVAAPAPQPQPPVANQPASPSLPTTGATGTQPPAPGASPAAPAAGAAASSGAATVTEPPAASGAQARSYHLKDKPPVKDMPHLTANQVEWLQGQLIAAGFDLKTSKSDGKDGKYGPLTHAAAEQIAKDAGINLKDVDFSQQSETTAKFFRALQARVDAHGRPTGAPAAAPAGPTPEQVAAQQAEAARQAAAAAETARIDAAQGPLRGTPFDARNLPPVQDYNGRYAIAREALLDMRELHSERRLQSNENLHDKMKEAVRDANKIMESQGIGKRFQSPSQDQPFTDDAMQALGIVALAKGKMRTQYDASVGVPDPMQAALAAANRQGVAPLPGANPQGIQGGNLGIATGGQSQTGGRVQGQ